MFWWPIPPHLVKEKLVVSTLEATPRRPRTALVALVTSFLVALSGLIMAPAAHAEPAVSLQATEAPREGGTVTVTGSGFSATGPGVYIGFGTAGLAGFYPSAGSLNQVVWVGPNNVAGGTPEQRTAPLNADGTFAVTFEVPAFADGTSYAVYTSKAHGMGMSDKSQDATATISYAAPAPQPATPTTTTLSASASQVALGEPVTLTATVAPAADGTVVFANSGAQIGATQQVVGGVATIQTADLAVGSHGGLTASFTPADPAAFGPSTGVAAPVTVVTPTPAGPAVEIVGSVTDLDPEAANVVTVKGTGFLPNAPATSGTRPPLAGKFTGAYVIFGSFADKWQPSTGAPSTTRVSIEQKWAVPAESMATIGGAARGAVELKADGSFQTTLTLTADESKALANGSYGIATYAAGGPVYAPFETFTPVTFASVPAGPSVKVVGSVTDLDPAAANVVTVRGSGFLPNPPETSGTRPPFAGQFTGTYVVFGSFADVWQPSTGAASATRVGLDTKWAVPAGSMATIGGESKGAVELNADGTFETTLTLTANESKALADGSYGIVTYPGGGAKYAAFETFTPVTFATTEPTPEAGLQVFLADGSTPYTGQPVYEGDTLVVSGTGFDPAANVGTSAFSPIPVGLPQGTFAVFGNFVADNWKPSAGAPSANRVMHTDARQWAITDAVFAQIPEAFKPTIAANRAVLGTDGSFTTKITVKAPTTALPAGGEWGIHTYAGGIGLSNADQELSVAVNYQGERPATKVAASLTKVVPGSGLLVDVTASGLPDVSAAYVAIIEKGSEAGLGQDGNYPAMEPFAEVKNGALTLQLNADATKLDRSKQYEVLVWKQHANPDANSIYGRADISISSAQWDQLFAVKPQPKPDTKPQPKPTDAKQAGALTWGVSSSFKAYATGPIARGSVSTSGVGSAGGAYLFPQAAGGAWNAATQTGSVQFSGVVTFSGHHGLMTESFANPVITVTSATSGTLSVGGRTFALNLGAASKSVGSQGEVSWSGVPVAGVISGGGSTGGGTGGGSFAADPLSFTVGAPSVVQFGSTTQSGQPAEREAAATPPATTGIRVVTPSNEITPGGEIEFEASGFEANERDILVVLYSDPIVLDRKAGANSSGTVRWIGKLPEDLELGTHTLTLQGSTNAGTVIEVVAPEKVKKSAEVLEANAADGQVLAAAAGIGDRNTGPIWLWWVGAGALLVLAAALGGLVVNQRRAASSASASAASGNVGGSIAS